MTATNLHFFSYLAAGLNATGFALYLGAQWRQRIKASPVNLFSSLLIVAGLFLSERALSSTQASLSYAVGVAAVLASFLLSLRNPIRWVRSDAGLLLMGVAFLLTSVVWPKETAVATSVYYFTNYISYISKLRAGACVEWWLPWAVWIFAALCMLAGLTGQSALSLLNPMTNLLCWSAVGWIAWRKQRPAPALAS